MRIAYRYTVPIFFILSISACSRSDLLDDVDDGYSRVRSDAGTDDGSGGTSASSDGNSVADDAGIDVRTACLGDQNAFVLLEDQWAPVSEVGDYVRVNWSHMIDGLPGSIEAASAHQRDWVVDFSTAGLGSPLMRGVYSASDVSFGVDGIARMEIVRYAQAEDYLEGQFEVVEMNVIHSNDGPGGDEIASATIVFSIPTPHQISGCLHIAHVKRV